MICIDLADLANNLSSQQGSFRPARWNCPAAAIKRNAANQPALTAYVFVR